MLHAAYPERQQLAWLFTTALAAVAVVILTPVQELGTAAYAMVAVAIAVGVLRYRLLGIEVVVRRALVYGTLTGLVLAVFVAVTTALAEVTSGDLVPQLLAACVIAVGAVPARDRLQRAVDRFVYGDRRDPWSALERLGSPMGSSAGDVVQAVVAAVAGALRAQGAAVVGADGTAVAEHGELTGAPVRVPLRFGGAELGVLAVAPRRGEHRLGKADERLLDAVAPLIAAVVHAERLAADLRAERARVVTATDAERRRLRQELHDGLGPSLTGVGLGLEAVETRTPGADPHTAELLGRLRSEVSAALHEIRRIIDDLRPAVFDELDLVTALRRRSEQITMSGALRVDFAAPAVPPRLAPECETAIYRIADEALTNVVRHAAASRCDVLLHVDGTVRLVVTDDGIGMIERVNGPGPGGVGLTSMRQRAERLGGTLTVERRSPGTAIVVDLPAGDPR
jgi:signal transduction histidine kinase